MGMSRVSRVVLEPAADLEPVHARHHDVEQDEVRLVGSVGDGKRLLAVGGHLGPERILEHAGHDRHIGRRVVDDEDELPVGVDIICPRG